MKKELMRQMREALKMAQEAVRQIQESAKITPSRSAAEVTPIRRARKG
jgi:hypothetical protein